MPVYPSLQADRRTASAPGKQRPGKKRALNQEPPGSKKRAQHQQPLANEKWAQLLISFNESASTDKKADGPVQVEPFVATAYHKDGTHSTAVPTSKGLNNVVLRAFDVITTSLWPSAKQSDVWGFILTKGQAGVTAQTTDVRALNIAIVNDALNIAIVKDGETAETMREPMRWRLRTPRRWSLRPPSRWR